MSSKQANIQGIFNSAVEEGTLSMASMQALKVNDIGEQIQNALGVSVDDVTASEVILVTMLIDDSGSIEAANNEQIVRDGHNLVIESLTATKQRDSILAHTKYLNGKILYAYCPIASAEKMTKNNYDANGGTPLYDQTAVILGTVLAKAQEFSANGVPVRTITLIVTDGCDQHSTKQTAKSVSKVVKDVLMQETHIIAAMGIDDGGMTDFTEVFKAMGVPDKWILTPSNNPSEIRKAFELFSQSAVQASQSGTNFSKTSMGGFGA